MVSLGAGQARWPPPIPGAREVESRTVTGPLELKQGSGDEEPVLAGTSFVRKAYQPSVAAPSLPLLPMYRDALVAAGWRLIDASQIAPQAVDGNVAISAHYVEDGQNIYAKLTQQPDGTLHMDVADVGAEDWTAQFADQCRLRIYSIHFQHNRPDIRLPESEATLRKLAEVLKGSTGPVEIEGHMDNIGEAGASVREALSLGRPRMVVEWLTTHGGVPASRLTANGFGRSRPVADNDSDWGRALNRRIEVTRSGCAPTTGRRLLGYTSASTPQQLALEKRFQAGVDAGSMSALHLPLSERPHPAGTPATRDIANHLATTLRGFGLDVNINEYQALLSHPRSVSITMTAPSNRVIAVSEPAIAGDPTSSHPELGGGYIAYSASGTATGQVVFVNYGLPADYEQLRVKGISVTGHVALARYGRSHRAVKVHTAQEAGARALILYSDPADDGAEKGSVWPEGYWRGPDMLQRGNAKLSWFWHGDPLTPGVAATATARRLDQKNAPTLPRIPVVVISATEASALRGVLDDGGPGPASVEIAVDMDQRLRPIYNVVASLKGRANPERRILFGTHHDAWTLGGVDPGTGATALLEVAKGLGALARAGWRPSRTIDIAFWDAEEFGLIGSTEHAEDFRSMLQDQLIAYVNIDMYMKGRFDPGGVPSLRAFVSDVVRDVPGRTSTVFDEWQPARWKALGSGADFVPFQDFLAVPALAIEFIGENGYGFGTYHSNYDSRAYVEKVADPGFEQGVTMARVLGTLALRMSEADVLPFRFHDYAVHLGDALTQARQWAADAGLALDVAALSTRAERVAVAARALDAAIDDRLRSGKLDRRRIAALNERLARLEQTLADDEGAPESRWYRHVFHGWNIYSLYDGQPLPGLAEALRLKDAVRAERETGRVARALDRFHAELAAALRDAR